MFTLSTWALIGLGTVQQSSWTGLHVVQANGPYLQDSIAQGGSVQEIRSTGQ